MSDAATIFQFEADFAGALYCIPMSVRLKLDDVGIKVSLKQWNKLSRNERDRLLAEPCETGAQRSVYRQLVAGLIEARTGAKAQDLPVDSHPEWTDASRIPTQVGEYFLSKGLAALTLEQWAGLTPLKRFVLIKLTRPGHSNENFLPALHEFGLLKGAA